LVKEITEQVLEIINKKKERWCLLLLLLRVM
jgi:hypothetical protein